MFSFCFNCLTCTILAGNLHGPKFKKWLASRSVAELYFQMTIGTGKQKRRLDKDWTSDWVWMRTKLTRGRGAGEEWCEGTREQERRWWAGKKTGNRTGQMKLTKLMQCRCGGKIVLERRTRTREHDTTTQKTHGTPIKGDIHRFFFNYVHLVIFMNVD